ncbi:MAG: hypothetical protein WAQ33_09335 [Gaiellaceae bacterium]
MRQHVVKGRMVVAVAVVCLVAVTAGCGGGSGSHAGAADATTTATDVATTAAGAAAGADCEELTSLIKDPAPTLGMTWDEAVLTKSSDLRDGSAALSRFASEAPEEIRPDFATVSAAWAKIARLIADLGVESGKSPDAAKVEATNQLVRQTLADPEISTASSRVSAWFESAVARCRSATTTETTKTVALGEFDKAATAAVNEALSKRTEADALSAPLGAEVRNCRKARELSENSLIAPGGTGYVCEVWNEGKMLFDGGIAVIDAKGNVVTLP